MKIKEDMSHVNQSLIDRGLMKIVPYSIRLDRYFTEEEMAANRKSSYSHSVEEWNVKCEDIRKQIAEENHTLMEHLKELCKIGQYEEDCNDYDLWFWCNDLYFTTSGKQSGRDYSYITLTFKEEDNHEKKIQLLNKIIEFLNSYKGKNIQAIIQYGQIEVTERIEEEAAKIYNECKEKYVSYRGINGKIEKLNGEYIFKKKYAKRYAYKMKPIDVCEIKVVA